MENTYNKSTQDRIKHLRKIKEDKLNKTQTP